MVFYGSFIKLLKCLFLVAITAYFVSMFVYPFFVIYCDGDYFEIAIDLKNLVDVLLEWQTLNAAMIALFSSVLAFYVSVYTAKIEKERNFIASKVFLPNVFAELTGYF